jgi:hypothetical protein
MIKSNEPCAIINYNTDMLLKWFGGLLKTGLKKTDLFPATQFIRFNKES